MKKYIYLSLVSALLVSFSSCKDSFLESVPSDRVTTGSYYKNDNDFILSINGVYNAFAPYRQDMEYFPMIDMATPIAVGGGGRFGVIEWGNSGFTPTNYHNDLKGWWANWWLVVARANEVVKRVDEEGSVISTEALRNRIKGEGLYLRAQAYFFLTYIWGDVPLYTTPNTGDNNFPKRAPHADVVAQMIQDLKDAETLLPSVKDYRATPALLGRASKGAAMALLGKVYCFEKQWSNAEIELKKLIDTGDYALTPGPTGFNDQFWPAHENGIESIFEIQYGVSSTNSNLQNAFVTFCATGNSSLIDPYGGNNYIEPTDYLTDKYETKNGYAVHSQWINRVAKDSFVFTSNDPAFDPLHSFDNRDPRLMWTVMYEGSPYVNAKFPNNKFKASSPKESNYATAKYIIPEPYQYGSDMNMIVLRYADVLLLYAEALMEQNKLSDAVTYVNMIRQRPSVNMPVVPAAIAADQGQLRTYIHDERIRELSCEYGHVFFDLRRWGIYVQEMKNWWTANKYGHVNPAITFDDHNVLWPIFQSEMQANPNITQNPGY